MIEHHRLSDLIQMIYSAGLSQVSWRDILGQVSKTVGHVSIALHSHDLHENSNIGFLGINYDVEHHASYRAYYAGINPWNKRAADLAVGRVFRSEEILPREQLRRTEFYNDWIRPQDDIGSGAGITLYRDQARFLRLSANIRLRDVDTMQDRLVELLALLSPHIKASFELARHIVRGGAGSQYEHLLAHIPHPAFLINRAGCVCLMNEAAELYQREKGGLRVTAGSILEFSTSIGQSAYLDRLSAIAESQPLNDPGFEIRVDEGRAFWATLLPFVTGAALEEPLSTLVRDEPMAILILEHRRHQDMFHHLMEEYGLSASEVALARHLHSGGTVRQFAERRQTSIHTARNQLRALLNKTGVDRQTNLFALMGTLSQRS